MTNASFPQEIFDHGDLADLPAVGLEDADRHLYPLQGHGKRDRPFELGDVVDAVVVEAVGVLVWTENAVLADTIFLVATRERTALLLALGRNRSRDSLVETDREPALRQSRGHRR
jgi:hypothetical protein